MKRLFPLLIAGAALALVGCTGPAPEPGHDSELSFEQAQAVAAERGVPLLIDFWKDG